MQVDSPPAPKTTQTPLDRVQLLLRLEEAEAAVTVFFEGLPAGVLNVGVGAAWTAAEHLVHLVTVTRTVAKGLTLPPWLLRLRFGKARAPSRSYEALRDDYRALLEAGGKASGIFIPPRSSPEPEPGRASAAPEYEMPELLTKWMRANIRIREALAPWTEQNLDRLSMPHPILGRLTVREMVMFTIYHNHHHIAAVQRRVS
jgi:hypothetical protein